MEGEARGHNLDIEPRNRLKQLADDCEDVLHNVGALLDEHRVLARGLKMACMRLLATDKSDTHQVDGLDEPFGCIEQYHHVSVPTWLSLVSSSFYRDVLH